MNRPVSAESDDRHGRAGQRLHLTIFKKLRSSLTNAAACDLRPQLRHMHAGFPSAIISIRLWGGGLDASPQNFTLTDDDFQQLAVAWTRSKVARHRNHLPDTFSARKTR